MISQFRFYFPLATTSAVPVSHTTLPDVKLFPSSVFVSRIRLSALALAMIGLNATQAFACPMCNLALESDDPQPKAYMISILFMLGMIGCIFGGFILFLYWVSRNEQASMDAAGYQHLFENAVSQNAQANS